MTNPMYNVSGAPANRSAGSSATIRAEFAAIAAGFDLAHTSRVLKTGDSMSGPLFMASAGVADAYIAFAIGGAGNTGFIGMAGASGNIINTSLVGELLYRTASKAHRFSVDGGASSALTIGAAGNVTIATPSGGVTLTVNGATTIDSANAQLEAIWNSTNASGGYHDYRSSGVGIGYIGAGAATGLSADAQDFAITSRVASKSLLFGTVGALRLGLTSDGRLYGTALHNNASSVDGTTNQYIASGTYTPTLVNQSNISASTPYQCQWLRVGNVVTVSGQLRFTGILAAASFLGISLPIPSDLAAQENLAGSITEYSFRSTIGAILGDAVNNRALVLFQAGGATEYFFVFDFTYLIS